MEAAVAGWQVLKGGVPFFKLLLRRRLKIAASMVYKWRGEGGGAKGQ